MAEEEAIPAAARAGVSRGVYVGTVVLIAIIAFVAGLGLSGVIFPRPTTTVQPPLIVATNTPFPPFESGDGANVVGFDIDVIGEIIDRMGRTMQIANYRDFGALLSAVQSGTVDIAASAITIRADRNATMDFSSPYFESDQAFLVRKNDNRITCSPPPTECQGTNLTGYQIAVQSTTTSEYWIYDNVPGGTANTTTYPDLTQALQALQSSAADVVVIDKPAGDGIVAANPTLYQLVGTVQTNELYGFAVQNNDPKGLIPQINAHLANMKTDGKYQELLDKWF